MSNEDLWIARVHQAMDRVLERPHEPLDLAEVARSVHASPFHFHRIFRHLVGETLHAFQLRVRLERALYAMVHSPHHSLTRIASDCGFSSSSTFSRSFKAHYGVSPRAFDLQGWRDRRRGELTEHNHSLARLPQGDNPDGFQVESRNLGPRRFVCSRVTNPFQPGRVTGAAETLVAWADEHGIDGQWAGWMWEDPELVPLSLCRYDVAVQTSHPPRAPFHTVDLPAMQVAVVQVRGSIELEQRALDWLYGTWLPQSGREPAPWPCAELWHGRPFAHGLEHFELELHLPLEK